MQTIYEVAIALMIALYVAAGFTAVYYSGMYVYEDVNYVKFFVIMWIITACVSLFITYKMRWEY